MFINKTHFKLISFHHFSHKRHLSHLAEESHSVCVPCVCCLGEVVVRPLMDGERQKYINQCKTITRTQNFNEIRI